MMYMLIVSVLIVVFTFAGLIYEFINTLRLDKNHKNNLHLQANLDYNFWKSCLLFHQFCYYIISSDKQLKEISQWLNAHSLSLLNSLKPSKSKLQISNLLFGELNKLCKIIIIPAEKNQSPISSRTAT